MPDPDCLLTYFGAARLSSFSHNCRAIALTPSTLRPLDAVTLESAEVMTLRQGACLGTIAGSKMLAATVVPACAGMVVTQLKNHSAEFC